MHLRNPREDVTVVRNLCGTARVSDILYSYHLWALAPAFAMVDWGSLREYVRTCMFPSMEKGMLLDDLLRCQWLTGYGRDNYGVSVLLCLHWQFPGAGHGRELVMWTCSLNSDNSHP